MPGQKIPARVPSGRLDIDLEKHEASYSRGFLDENSRPGDKGNTYVAILDVLGFRPICETTPPLTIRDGLRAIEDQLVSAQAGIEAQARQAGLTYPKLHWLIFSDTLMLYTETASPQSLQHICGTVAFSIGIGLAHGLKLRGAVVRGELLVDKRPDSPLPVFLGTGLVAAHDLEKTQKWTGAIVDVASVVQSDVDQAMLDHLLVADVLCKYAVPIGNPATPTDRVCIDWPRYTAQTVLNETRLRDGLAKLLASGPAHQPYDSATMQFFRDRRSMTSVDDVFQRARLRLQIWWGRDPRPQLSPAPSGLRLDEI